MKHKCPLMLTGYRSVQSFTVYILYHGIYVLRNSFLSAFTWYKYFLMKSDNHEGRFNTVCETNPLKNDKYQKLERGSYQI